MEGNEEFLSKVEAKEGTFYLFIQMTGLEPSDGFELHVTDGSEVWGRNVTEDLLQEMASKAEMDLTEYTQQTLQALTGQNATNDYVYQAVENETGLEFSWKKVLDDGVKYQLGCICLTIKERNKEFMQKVLNFSILKMDAYQDNIKSMKTNIEQLSKDYSNAILRLEKCVVSKEEMELDLFQKFVAVLNDKKAKIRRLQDVNEKLQAKADQIISDQGTVQNVPTHTKRNGDTDDKSNPQPGTSESSKERSSNTDTSLYEEDIGPVVKRRRANRSKTVNVTTPSKPVLPEVKTPGKRTVSNASTDSTASNESKQSGKATRKSSRAKKNTATFPDDVNDLFGDMA